MSKKAIIIIYILSAIMLSVRFIQHIGEFSYSSVVRKVLIVLIGICALGSWICLIIGLLKGTKKNEEE